jgi:hypothetical protein
VTDLTMEWARITAEVARIAAMPGRIEQRAEALLDPLRRIVPFQAVWISLLDQQRREQPPLVALGYPHGLADHMSGPGGVDELETLGLTRSPGAIRLTDMPIPLDQMWSWSEFLAPAGFRNGLAAALYTTDGRYLGVLGVNTDSVEHPSDEARDLIGLLVPTLAYALDPMRSVAAAARVVRDGRAGTVLTRGGETLPLPGLPGHPLLSTGSGALDLAARAVADGYAYTTFLCPYADGDDTHVRVTALSCPPQPPHNVVGVVLVSPAGDLRGLTGRDLEILGLLVDDWADERIAAALHLPSTSVAAAIVRILAAVRAPTRAHAAFRAVRSGLYVPRALGPGR